MTTRLKIVLFFVILVVPGLLAAVTAEVSFSRAQTTEFCGSCHVMTPWHDNVTNPESDSLAAEHFKRRWIQKDQCYTCHSDYGFLGTIEAKVGGMHHVAAYYFGEPGRIELYKEFPNANCLKCHAESKGFLEDSNHEPIEDLLAGKDRCVECHENLHEVEQPEYDGEDGGAGSDEDGEGAAADAGDAGDAVNAEPGDAGDAE